MLKLPKMIQSVADCFAAGEREGAGGGDSARGCSGFEKFTPGAVSHPDSPRTGRTGRGWEDHDKAMVV